MSNDVGFQGVISGAYSGYTPNAYSGYAPNRDRHEEEEELHCEICTNPIPEGKAHVTYPDLAHYIDPGVMHMQIWCDPCHRDFQKTFREWRRLRLLRVKAHPSIE